MANNERERLREERRHVRENNWRMLLWAGLVVGSGLLYLGFSQNEFNREFILGGSILVAAALLGFRVSKTRLF